jgi:hypothetical protein
MTFHIQPEQSDRVQHSLLYFLYNPLFMHYGPYVATSSARHAHYTVLPPDADVGVGVHAGAVLQAQAGCTSMRMPLTRFDRS